VQKSIRTTFPYHLRTGRLE